MSETREIAFDLPASHRTVRVARNLARRFARMEGLAERDTDSMLLVLSELLANAVDHGGGGAAMDTAQATAARMRAAVRLDDDAWVVRVTDEGGGDAAALQAAVDEQGLPDLEDERGRGLFLMRELTDSLQVESVDDGRGLTIIATKRYQNDA